MNQIKWSQIKCLDKSKNEKPSIANLDKDTSASCKEKDTLEVGVQNEPQSMWFFRSESSGVSVVALGGWSNKELGLCL